MRMGQQGRNSGVICSIEHSQFIQALLEAEVTDLLGRAKSARRSTVEAPGGYCNGYGRRGGWC